LETGIAPKASEKLRHRPIFFLGAPRSGSTLMMQVITDALDVGYISNRHCQWFGAPALAEWLFHPARLKPSSSYCSRYGVTNDPFEPAECGRWWYRFFRRNPPYVTLDEVEPKKMIAFRRSVAALTNVFDRPVIFKNLYASLRIQAIAHYLPESLFIVTHRNEVDNGHSLLEVRESVFNDYQRWWSMEPPGTEGLKQLPAHQQVIEQIRHIHATIDRDMATSGVAALRRLDLHYEEFCAEPLRTLADVQAFLAGHGCNLEQRGQFPEPFTRREKIRIDKDLYDAMVEYAQRT
jgi:LPS sulfotransferase NodH